MLKLAKASALIDDRKFVNPDDVKSIAMDVLAHRILLSFECTIEGVDAKDIIRDILDAVPVPTEFS